MEEQHLRGSSVFSDRGRTSGKCCIWRKSFHTLGSIKLMPTSWSHGDNKERGPPGFLLWNIWTTELIYREDRWFKNMFSPQIWVQKNWNKWALSLTQKAQFCSCLESLSRLHLLKPTVPLEGSQFSLPRIFFSRSSPACPCQRLSFFYFFPLRIFINSKTIHVHSKCQIKLLGYDNKTTICWLALLR